MTETLIGDNANRAIRLFPDHKEPARSSLRRFLQEIKHIYLKTITLRLRESGDQNVHGIPKLRSNDRYLTVILGESNFTVRRERFRLTG